MALSPTSGPIFTTWTQQGLKARAVGPVPAASVSTAGGGHLRSAVSPGRRVAGMTDVTPSGRARSLSAASGTLPRLPAREADRSQAAGRGAPLGIPVPAAPFRAEGPALSATASGSWTRLTTGESRHPLRPCKPDEWPATRLLAQPRGLCNWVLRWGPSKAGALCQPLGRLSPCPSSCPRIQRASTGTGQEEGQASRGALGRSPKGREQTAQSQGWGSWMGRAPLSPPEPSAHLPQVPKTWGHTSPLQRD